MSFFKKSFTKKYSSQSPLKATTSSELLELGIDEKKINSHIDQCEQELREIFQNTSDFSFYPVKMGGQKGFVVGLNSLISSDKLDEKIMSPIMSINQNVKTIQTEEELENIRLQYFAGIPYEYNRYYHETVWNILNGYVVIFIEGLSISLAILINDIEYRTITEPSTQTIIRGPKDGFIESLETNISLIRRRIRNPNLKFEEMIIGKDSKTKVTISFLHNVTNKGIVKELKERLKNVNVSAIMDSGNIDEAITDKTLTPFPLIFNTERPDIIASGILEGKVAVLVDGSPFVLLLPTVFSDFFIASEDYYQPFYMTSFIRIIRYISFMISLLMPALYVAITTYHQELLPTQLLINVQAQREGVPFPAVIEILLMEITFEILREAGVRMPRAVGQTVSIVGALVIGQAAVEAGLVSNVLVIIVAITAIASFVTPIYNFSVATRLLRFLLILFSSLMGLFGVFLFLMLMVFHLVSLRSFGVPYLAPIAPLIIEDQKDVFIRFPIWSNKERPSYLHSQSPIKFKKEHNPSPPKQEGDENL